MSPDISPAQPGGLVLVTGGSGFIGSHCIIKLLAAGYRVRTTVRSIRREPEVRAMLAAGGAGDLSGSRLEFAEADLMSDAGWAEAASGCDYVLHVASPLPVERPRFADDLIRPAVEGTRRVLRVSRDAGVRRVVVTSSFAAIGYGHAADKLSFDETDWTQPAENLHPYVLSKYYAERAAWELIDREGGGLELATVNPVVVLGPALGADMSASLELVRAMLTGRLKVLPRIAVGIVDVRDVADLHLLAMTSPDAAGQRFLAASGGFMWLSGISAVLRENLGDAARRAPRLVVPDMLVRLASLVSPLARQAAGPDLGRRKHAASDKAMAMLGWSSRSPEEAILAAARSLIELRAP